MLDSSAASATITERHRGPGRPFVKGQSGNPAGRASKPPDVGALARKHAVAAIRALTAALTGPDAAASVAAAATLLEHGFGAPMQHVALYVPNLVLECRDSAPEPARPNGSDREIELAWNA